MNDISQLMRLAQSAGMMPGAGAADGIGPRMTLALLSAIENRDCGCEPCQQLRAVVAFMRESARATLAGSGAPGPTL